MFVDVFADSYHKYCRGYDAKDDKIMLLHEQY